MTWLSSEAEASMLCVWKTYIFQLINLYQVQDLGIHIYLPLLFHSRELTHPSWPSNVYSKSRRCINCGALWRRLYSNLSVSKYDRFTTSWVVLRIVFENIVFRFILWLVVVTSVETPATYLSGCTPPKTNILYSHYRERYLFILKCLFYRRFWAYFDYDWYNLIHLIYPFCGSADCWQNKFYAKTKTK